MLAKGIIIFGSLAGIALWIRLFVLVGLPLLELYLGLFILIAIARGQRHRLRRLVMFGWARAIGSQGERAHGLQGREPTAGHFCRPRIGFQGQARLSGRRHLFSYR